MLSFPDPPAVAQGQRLRLLQVLALGTVRFPHRKLPSSSVFHSPPALCTKETPGSAKNYTVCSKSAAISPQRSGRFHYSSKLFSKYTRKVISCFFFFFFKN